MSENRRVCQGKITLRHWHVGTLNVCRFKASVQVGNKWFCKTHATKEARTKPYLADVLKFIFSERDKNSQLWQTIEAAYNAWRKP